VIGDDSHIVVTLDDSGQETSVVAHRNGRRGAGVPIGNGAEPVDSEFTNRVEDLAAWLRNLERSIDVFQRATERQLEHFGIRLDDVEADVGIVIDRLMTRPPLEDPKVDVDLLTPEGEVDLGGSPSWWRRLFRRSKEDVMDRYKRSAEVTWDTRGGATVRWTDGGTDPESGSTSVEFEDVEAATDYVAKVAIDR
jgi:hypothetical protein